MGACLARLLATMIAAPLVGASRRALLLFQTVAACHTKVSALVRRGRGMVPMAAALVLLSPLLLKRRFPTGFMDPLGPSELWWAFQATMATARTAMELREGISALASSSGILT